MLTHHTRFIAYQQFYFKTSFMFYLGCINNCNLWWVAWDRFLQIYLVNLENPNIRFSSVYRREMTFVVYKMFPQKECAKHLSNAWDLQTKAYKSGFPRAAMINATQQFYLLAGISVPAPATELEAWACVDSYTHVHTHTQCTCCDMLLRYFLPFIQKTL